MSLMDLIAQLLGKHIDYDGAYGPQCTDLVEVYIQRCHSLPPIPGNGGDFYANAPGALWTKTPNGPFNYPDPGDIVCWGISPAMGIGAAGHVGVCVMADDMHLISLDQNWPVGAPVSLVLHSFVGVQGWLKARAR